MKKQLPTPPIAYSRADQVQVRFLVEQEDRRNVKRDEDYEPIGQARIILHSPNGSRFALTVSNGGVLSASPL